MSLATGMIIIWSGAIVDIPDGFVLCNGANGTPDLRDRFIVGAGSTYNPDDTGGSDAHTHDYTGDAHSHSLIGGTGIQIGGGLSSTFSSVQSTGTTDSENHLPPYYALAYIMKT